MDRRPDVIMHPTSAISHPHEGQTAGTGTHMLHTQPTPEDVRRRRLADINARLSGLGLGNIPKLYDWTVGGEELVEIIDVDEHSKRWFYTITFRTILPGGIEGTRRQFFPSRKGVVVALFLNGTRVGMVRQTRATHGEFFTEAPRGFGGPAAPEIEALLDGYSPEAIPAMRIVLRELPTAARTAIEDYQVWHLGDLAEDTGFKAGYTEYYLVNLKLDIKLIGQRSDHVAFTTEDGIRLETMTWMKALSLRRDGNTSTVLADFAPRIRQIMTGLGYDIGPDRTADVVITSLNGRFHSVRMVDPDQSTAKATEYFDDLSLAEARLVATAMSSLTEEVLEGGADYDLWELGSFECTLGVSGTKVTVHLVDLDCGEDVVGADAAMSWGKARASLTDAHGIAALYRFQWKINECLELGQQG